MSKKEVITWEHCRFINAEFSHYTFNGNGKNTAYFLAHDIALHKFEYTSCTPLANDIHSCKVLAFYAVAFYWARDKKILLSVTPCND